ncbi:hypothetical protein BC833DRAFT_604219 [Globomyces pollinis-pini]|nr:hypothetical protein BC833DRAFT_604219 [Globomyces pollinis-pini]
MKSNNSVVVAILIFILQLSGIYLFKEGFLLTRIELNTVSDQTSTIKPKFNRTLFIMVDALRFDFIHYNHSIANQDCPHYINKVPIIRDKLKYEPQNALLFRGLADPPTTTLQRLMAMMTGALPTLVDAGSNFASSALKEDNIISKLLARRDRVIALGDDTWDRLFPSSFNESHFFPSFDVWDLHTLDKGVLSHLMPMLDEPIHDWGFLVAHFLGVDHAGHRYGPGHVAMGDKLTEMNDVFAKIFDKVHDDTLVVIMGDHGMDKKGDHGGESFEEIDAALFFYSKTPLTTNSISYKSNIKHMVKEVGQLGDDYSIFSYWKGHRTVQQIDLVPTLSLLMGINIPFGNLGTVIPELFMDSTDDWKSAIETIRINAIQLSKYLESYSNKRSDAKQSFAKSVSLFNVAEENYLNLDINATSERKLAVYIDYVKFLRHSLIVARYIWSRFEHTLMGMGIIILFLSLLATFLVYFTKSIPILSLKVGVFTGICCSLIGFLSPIRIWFYPHEDPNSLTLKRIHECLFFGILGLLFSIFFSFKLFNPFKKITSAVSLIGILIMGLFFGSAGSDSFIIFEDHVILHFVQFLHCIMFLGTFALAGPLKRRLQIRIFFCAIITRIISFVTLCRPDQGPYCTPTFYSSPTSSISSIWTPFVLIPITVLTVAYTAYSGRYGNRFIVNMSISLSMSNIYWLLDTLESHSILTADQSAIKDWFTYGFWLNITVAYYLFGRQSKNLLPLCYILTVLFQKPMGGIVISLFYIYLLTMHSSQVMLPKSLKSLTMPLYFLMGLLTFYSTGHQNQLVSVQYDIAFIGLKTMTILSPIYVAFNTFGGPLMSLMVSDWSIMQIIYSFELFVSIFFCGWFSRHSQAFRVWSQKFLFFGSMYIFTSAIMIIKLLLVEPEHEEEPEEELFNKDI